MTLNTADKIRDKISTTKTEMMKEKLTLVCLLNVKRFIIDDFIFYLNNLLHKIKALHYGKSIITSSTKIFRLKKLL